MGDGAHLGVGAGRALKTILGGEPPPTEAEQESREEVRARLAMVPNPCTGAPPQDYSDAADRIAKAFLLVSDADPALPIEADALWAAVKARWPNFNEWVGGASGFQIGWAANCVRWLKEQPPAENPALLEIREP